MTTYQQTLDYLFSQLPMFQRLGAVAYKKDLGNTIALCEVLGNPQNSFRSIHIAGTNGKGSTSHFLASILQSAGFRVGLYTSPHLKDFRERIKVNGVMISEEEVIRFTEENKQYFEQIEPSFFEMTVAMAFHYFRAQEVDIAVIETGMGGRLDSSNIITPILSVITNIGHDHQQFLGDTLAKIAFEKAGIIKQNVPVIIGEQQDETTSVFEEKANEYNAPIQFASNELELLSSSNSSSTYSPTIDLTYRWKSDKTIELVTSGLAGPHQHKNVRTVLCAIRDLQRLGLSISPEALQNGLTNVVKQTSLLGRWQQLSANPLVICDTGHNKEGIAPIVAQLVALATNKKLYIVWGMVQDKDHDSILCMLPKDAHYYFCCPNIPRGQNAELLCALAQRHGLNGVAFPSVSAALNQAKSAANTNDIVFVGGSTFVVAEVV